MTNRIKGAQFRNYQWDRVQSTPRDPAEQDRKNRIDAILVDKVFLKVCAWEKIPVTRRQASKYARKRGRAYQTAMSATCN